VFLIVPSLGPFQGLWFPLAFLDCVLSFVCGSFECELEHSFSLELSVCMKL
jgi:hypothetical protein